ncbi:Alpha/Beta hydrolase protein [Xylariaceae sp. FL0662B]|nr:Alpha/Beta hydrolase protein [Xylariaceae sp. FL0662B]
MSALDNKPGARTLASAPAPQSRPRPQQPEEQAQQQQHRLLAPDPASLADADPAQTTPLVICFHGSGESCSPSWDALADLLAAQGLRVLLFERGEANPGPEEATAALRRYLKAERLQGPYVLVAHSYGGAFLRTFAHPHLRKKMGRRKKKKAWGGDGDEIAGAVLVETGQEGGLSPRLERAQYRDPVLGARPLSVVRGNTLIAQWKGLEGREARTRTEGERDACRRDREMLRVCDEEDQRLKRRQLGLSRTSRFVQVEDCGHHVVRDRPDVVAAEVRDVICDRASDILAVTNPSQLPTSQSRQYSQNFVS